VVVGWREARGEAAARHPSSESWLAGSTAQQLSRPWRRSAARRTRPSASRCAGPSGSAPSLSFPPIHQSTLSSLCPLPRPHRLSPPYPPTSHSRPCAPSVHPHPCPRRTARRRRRPAPIELAFSRPPSTMTLTLRRSSSLQRHPSHALSPPTFPHLTAARLTNI
jgi:hypothetical protein